MQAHITYSSSFGSLEGGERKRLNTHVLRTQPPLGPADGPGGIEVTAAIQSFVRNQCQGNIFRLAGTSGFQLASFVVSICTLQSTLRLVTAALLEC